MDDISRFASPRFGTCQRQPVLASGSWAWSISVSIILCCPPFSRCVNQPVLKLAGNHWRIHPSFLEDFRIPISMRLSLSLTSFLLLSFTICGLPGSNAQCCDEIGDPSQLTNAGLSVPGAPAAVLSGSKLKRQQTRRGT